MSIRRLPQQPRDIERPALAPYNFVPLPERVVTVDPNSLPDQDAYADGRLTGYIDCELQTASPIYIRAALPAKDYAAGAKSKDNSAFFYMENENKPVIPGSSLRGLFRTLVEIISFSKMSAVTNKRLVYRAIGDTTSHGDRYRTRLVQDDGNKYFTPLIRGGYIEQKDGEWVIQPAQESGGTTYAHIPFERDMLKRLRPIPGCHNAYEIYIQTGPYEYQPVRGPFLHVKFARVRSWQPNPSPGLKPGITTLAESGPMTSKRTEAVIYERDPNPEAAISIPDELLDAYREQVTKEQIEILDSRNADETTARGVLRQGQPIFYLLDDQNKLFFFGHCRMFRLPYPNTPVDYIPERLRRETDLDMVEALFGYTKETGKEKARAYASRISFSDAQLTPGQEDIWLVQDRIVIPKVLSSPKPTTFQHYLVQTKPNRVQIGTNKKGEPRYTLRLADYASVGETVIRGHKLYWHKGSVGVNHIREEQAIKASDAVHTRIQPLKADVKFQFRIHFENLSREELGAILWVLNKARVWDTQVEDQFRLKLGMGKPYGMGAVGINSRLFLTTPATRYSRLLDDDAWHTGRVASDDRRDELMIAFERFILRELNDAQARSLEELDRIQELLAMLRWPGPDPAKTRYLEIEHWDGRKIENEYRNRPVLPPPAVVAGRSGTSRSREQPPPQATKGREESQGQIKEGTVVRYKGTYGFVEQDNTRQQFFVHQNELRGGIQELKTGDRVRFQMGPGKKGDLVAKEVELIK